MWKKCEVLLLVTRKETRAYMLEKLFESDAHRRPLRSPEVRIGLQQQHHLTHIVCPPPYPFAQLAKLHSHLLQTLIQIAIFLNRVCVNFQTRSPTRRHQIEIGKSKRWHRDEEKRERGGTSGAGSHGGGHDAPLLLLPQRHYCSHRLCCCAIARDLPKLFFSWNLGCSLFLLFRFHFPLF